MKIFITGGSGFIGSSLSRMLLEQGHQVQATGTSSGRLSVSHKHFNFIQADTSRPGEWQDTAAEADMVVNLAGRTIFKRWTRKYKQQMYDSRVLTTRNLVEALENGKAKIFCSTSAAGIYGSRGDEILTEDSSPGDDFLARICVDWEKEAFRLQERGIRVAIMRLGVVLGKNGGALKKMLPAYKFFMGGPLGDGRQWFPWVHIRDIHGVVQTIMDKGELKGPMNVCAPGSVMQREFAEILAKSVKRPHFARVPAVALSLAMGEMGGALLASQRAVPQKLQELGYEFKFDRLAAALNDLIHK